MPSVTAGCLIFLIGLSSLLSAADSFNTEHTTKKIEGWTVLVNNDLLESDAPAVEQAMKLLQVQLAEIVQVVPRIAVAQLQKVPLWFSPEYSGHPPRAEYHPNAGWLRENQRNPAMAQAVEFTNVRIFDRETKRMPNFALHELAHAYHDQVLPKGFDNPDIETLFEKARSKGMYDRVEQRSGDGRSTNNRAYAITSRQEYFAEGTEAFFSTNDFFPFNRVQLSQHDPDLLNLLKQLWQLNALPPIGLPSPELNVPAFYTKYIDANGYPIVSSGNVNDYALREAAYLVNLMLAERPDIRAAMIRNGSRLCILAHNEFTTDLPEWADMTPKDYWDARARGTGGSQTDPFCSCGEENLLGYPGDPYSTENILIHEFAHNIHLRGMAHVDAGFDPRVKLAYEHAMAAGLWKGKYASVNHHEYFAEGVQSWFDNNRENDHDHNHVNTRDELVDYDPGLAALCQEVFGDTRLTYTNPHSRLRDHLAEYDPSTAPRFLWPERLLKTQKEIQRDAKQRSEKAKDTIIDPLLKDPS